MKAAGKANNLIDALADGAGDALRAEVKRLREIEAWALGSLPIQVGDAVAISRVFKGPTKEGSPGWWGDREHLIPGATGIVEDVWLGDRGWYALYRPDVEWSVSEWADARHVYYPREGHGHTFMMRMSSLRPRTVDDVELVAPPENGIGA